MSVKFNKATLSAAIVLAATVSTSLSATEGYFQTAFGARHGGMAGAGLASITDSAGLGLNPAGIVGIGTQFNVGLKLFRPSRKTTGSGQPGLTPLGEVKSGKSNFAFPNISFVYALNDKSALGIGFFANGGMNTSYGDVSRDVMECGGGSGVFCSGKAGVDLQQTFLTVGYAYQVTDHLKIGISPMLATQRFSAKGIGALSAFSADPENFSDRGKDTSFGTGFKAGATYEWDRLSIAATYQSRFNMDKFNRYAGLFAESGGFDVPSSYSAGLAYKVSDKILVVADYRRVNYNSVQSIGNPSTNQLPFGSDQGPGFGWGDVDAYKVGVEIKHSDHLTYRFGAGTNTNPVTSRDVTLNVLAPGVVTRHYSAGFTYDLGDGHAIQAAATYAPYHSVSGQGFANPNHIVEIGMKQSYVSAEWQISF